jgi:hypothetical protein
VRSHRRNDVQDHTNIASSALTVVAGFLDPDELDWGVNT